MSFLNGKSFCLCVFLSLTSLLSWGSNVVVINNGDQLNTPGTKYIINTTVDFGGRRVKVPEGCTLVFKRKGKIINGTIEGKQTAIKSLKKQCLGVIFKGSWVLPKIDDKFFDFSFLTDNQVLDNITALQSDGMKNKIILNKPVYNLTLTKEHRTALYLSSNTVFLCNSSLEVEGNDLPIYTVVEITRKKNVTVKGGQIIGDVGRHRYIEGSTSEWGYGIYVFHSSNVLIEDVHVSKCIGDGIFIGGGSAEVLEEYSKASNNIYVKNAICDDNRRQGISITCADGVVLENCIFSNTGKTEFTKPGCGLDIEPNKGQSIRNVRIKNCRFVHNDRIMDISVGGYKTENAKCNVEGIVFDDCLITGMVSIRTGSLIMKRCSMKTLEIHLAKMPKEKVMIEKCSIKDGKGVMIRTVDDVSNEDYLPVYSFKSCTIGMEDLKRTSLFSTVNHRGDEKARFEVDDCSIVLAGGDGDLTIVPTKSKMPFSFSNCKIHPNGRVIELDKKVFSGCRIIDGKL